jgi:hypothetical protein
MKTRLLTLSVLALTALALALSACGGGDSTTIIETTTVTGESTDSTATDETTSTEQTTTESTTTDASTPPQHLDGFQTPSGNIGCVALGNQVRCDIAKHSWDAGKAPNGCPLDYGDGLTMKAGGNATFVCAGDTTLNPQAPVLDYGESSEKFGITCASAEDGLTCKNADGMGFFLSAQSYQFIGA